MKLYLATQNVHKVQELSLLFPQHEILPAPVAFDVIEDGLSFYENARKKALALYELVQAPVLADDSGLCIAAFDGGPGIYTARFGDELGMKTAEDRYNLVLERMRDVPDDEREAYFACSLWAMVAPGVEYMVQSRLEGCIAREAIAGGFGYDPIFYLPELGKMLSELSTDEKNSLSHRGKAAQLMNNLLYTNDYEL